jgi:hypothetical protein
VVATPDPLGADVLPQRVNWRFVMVTVLLVGVPAVDQRRIGADRSRQGTACIRTGQRGGLRPRHCADHGHRVDDVSSVVTTTVVRPGL